VINVASIHQRQGGRRIKHTGDGFGRFAVGEGKSVVTQGEVVVQALVGFDVEAVYRIGSDIATTGKAAVVGSSIKEQELGIGWQLFGLYLQQQPVPIGMGQGRDDQVAFPQPCGIGHFVGTQTGNETIAHRCQVFDPTGFALGLNGQIDAASEVGHVQAELWVVAGLKPETGVGAIDGS